MNSAQFLLANKPAKPAGIRTHKMRGNFFRLAAITVPLLAAVAFSANAARADMQKQSVAATKDNAETAIIATDSTRNPNKEENRKIPTPFKIFGAVVLMGLVVLIFGPSKAFNNDQNSGGDFPGSNHIDMD